MEIGVLATDLSLIFQLLELLRARMGLGLSFKGSERAVSRICPGIE